MIAPSAGDGDLDAQLARAATAESAGELRRSLGLLTRAMATAEAGGRRYQYLYEWRARLESSLGQHADADASLVIARGLADVAGSRHGVYRMDVARAEVAIAALDLARAEQLFAGLCAGGAALGPVTAERCGAVIAWLRDLRFPDRPQPNVALVRVETALTLVDLWSERGKYRSALRLIAAIERDLPAAEIAIRIDQVRLREVELRIEAGELGTARERLAQLGPAGDAIDRTRAALVRARLGLAGGHIADAAGCLDDLAAAPDGDPQLATSATAARVAILAELNLWQTAADVATRAIERLGTGPAMQPLVDRLTRARIAARARGRSVLAMWELAIAPRDGQDDDTASNELLRLDVAVAAPTRFTERWTRHANEVILALERSDPGAAAQHQAALEAATEGVESSYIAARVRLSAALVAYCAGPGPATCEALQAIASELHAIGARGAEAQALRYAAWSAARRERIDEYVALARRAASILEDIAGELPPVQRSQYLLNKWNGRDEFVAGRMRELRRDDDTDVITAHRRDVCRAFRDIELLTHWPVDQAFGDHGAEQLLHETSDAHARWVHELQAASSRRQLRGFQLRSPLSLWRLPRRTLVLHYHVLPDRSYLFRMVRGHIDVRVLRIGRLQLQFNMQRAVGDPERLRWLATHTGIAEALEDFPGTRRLVIVPHDAIAGVPFAALPVDGEPLCTRRIAISQIDRLERLQRRRWFRKTGRGVAIGLASYRGSGAKDLPDAEREARTVAAVLGGEPRVGDQSTCDAMCAALRDAAWVHVAAHGAVDAADPAGSGILLRDGAGYRTLALRELRRIEAARPWLVTLATCRSADAPVLPGGARICIPSALLDAGARGVIAALWPIDDAPSVELMEALYRRLRDERPSVALARMQAELRARPAHQWAGLMFYGND